MSNWISVKDRLPIDEFKEFKRMHPCKNFEVIVMRKNLTIPMALYFDGIYFTRGGLKFRSVTHWQPLPEPPKGDENNAD